MSRVSDQPITGTILVADDQSSNRELLEELLITQGFTVIAASDGVAALGELSRVQADLVGFSELLADGTPGELNDKQKRFVNHIKQGSAHLLQLINDILDLSKIEAGQLELRCEDFQVKDALPEVLSTIRPLAMAKNIQVQQKLETDRAVSLIGFVSSKSCTTC